MVVTLILLIFNQINYMGKKQQTEKTDLETKLDSLEKKYGLGRISPDELTIVSTGSIQLNVAMQIGGTALGKLIEVIGPESSGKTSLALHQLAEYQKAFPDRKVALFDYEHSYSNGYAKEIGIDINNFLLYQPDTLEMGYDMILGLIANDMVSCIVVDSQTAAAPKAVIDGEMEDSTIGLQARMNSKFCLKVKGLLSIHNTTLFLVSQTRANVGSNTGDISTGGNAIKFYSDVRWKLWKIAKKEEGLNVTTIDVIKSKLGRPYGQAKVNLLWGKGLDQIGEVIDYAVELGYVEKTGMGWFTIEGVKLQGMTKARTFLENNMEYYEVLREKVINSIIPKKEKFVNEDLYN